jgi:hypothetical protein
VGRKDSLRTVATRATGCLTVVRWDTVPEGNKTQPTHSSEVLADRNVSPPTGAPRGTGWECAGGACAEQRPHGRSDASRTHGMTLIQKQRPHGRPDASRTRGRSFTNYRYLTVFSMAHGAQTDAHYNTSAGRTKDKVRVCRWPRHDQNAW